MKFCINCGQKLDDNSKFCTGCGTRVEEPKPVSAPVFVPVNNEPVVQRPAPAQKSAYEPKYAYQAPAAPVYQPPVKPQAPKKPAAPKKKKSKLPLILGIAGVALLVVIAVVVLLLSGALMGDKGKVGAAFVKTAGAYADATKDMNLDMEAANALVESQEYSEALELKIKSVPYYEELTGLGVRMDMRYSLPQKAIDMTLVPMYGSADLVELNVAFQDDMMYAAAPDVVKGLVLAVNTETIGQDLYDMGAIYDEEEASLGFNIFEIVQIISDFMAEMKENQQIPKEDLLALMEEITVEKVGKTTTDVNDASVKCVEYAVEIPQEVLEDLMEMVEDAYGAVDVMDLAKDLVKAIGAPDYVLEEMTYSMPDTANMFEGVYEFLDELGDIECSVFVAKGYVMAINGELSAYDSDLEYSIQLGGDGNYVDTIGIYLKADDEKVEIVSTGDHSAKDGVYTDETVIKAEGGKIKITSSFDPKGTDENFEISMSGPEGIKLSVSGLILADENGYTLNLDKCSLTADGETLSVSMSCVISAYEEGGMSTSGALEVLKMSEDELMAELENVSDEAMAWAEKFMAENGELLEMLEYMMY